MAALQPGDSLAHFRIIDLLGAGGMGEVYLAEDERLQRKVALKLLPPGLSGDAERVRRFEQEARAASALNHPNIVTVFDLGQSGEHAFIATELVDGRSLRDEMRTRIRLPADEAIRIVLQCAAGLTAAHAAGIVHRDIKPENVMLRPDGWVKLLDFGLAKIEAAASPDTATVTNLTTAGAVLGTVGYLSPEQARGQHVDARTDVFSLGVMLYEMIAGARPFKGQSDNDTIAAILREDPAPLRTRSRDVPAGMQDVLDKALAKDRDRRYASMTEFASDLQRLAGAPASAREPGRAPSLRRVGMWSGAVALIAVVSWLAWTFTGRGTTAVTPAVPSPVKTLAVLPFKLIGGASTDSEHLGLGLADALIVKLTNQRQVTVRPTNAVLRFADGDADAGEAGRTLRVDAVLVGTVQRAGDRIRVRAQLVRTPVDGAAVETIWNDEFPETGADMLELQDRLAATVVDRLAIPLSRDEQQRMARRDTNNPRAYQLYLEGRYFVNRRSEAGYRRAIDLFGQAVRHDPQFARPYVSIALCWNSLIELGNEPPSAIEHVRTALARALALDETLGEAHAYQSLVSRINDWQFAEAERRSTRSMELEPDHPAVLLWRGVHLLATGRAREALDVHRRALEIDPLDLSLRAQLSRACYLTKQYDEAITVGRALIQLDEAQSPAHQWVGSSLSALGRHADAFVHLERAVQLSPKSPERQAALAHGYALGRRQADARRILGSLQLVSQPDDYLIATIHAALDDSDAAFASLELARQRRNAYFANRLALDPKLDPLRSDSRFPPLLRVIGLQ